MQKLSNIYRNFVVDNREKISYVINKEKQF